MPGIDPTQQYTSISKQPRNIIQGLSLTQKAYQRRRGHNVQVTDFAVGSLLPDVTDLAIQSTNTQLRSAAQPFVTNDGSYTAGYAKVVNVTGGTGFTPGFYSVATDATITATMDRAVGTANSTNGSGQFFLMGEFFDVSDFNECIVEVIGTTLVVGSGANLRVLVQILSLKNAATATNATWYNLPVSPTFPTNPVTNGNILVAGNSMINAFTLPTGFGDLIRLGLSTGTQCTSGNLSTVLKFKG